MIVVDASVLSEVLLRTPVADAVEVRLFGSPESLHAPHLLDVEVTQVLRRFVLNGEIEPDLGRAMTRDLADFPIRRYPHDFLLQRVWELRDNLTAHDAIYVALAEALDAPLVTRDGHLASSSGHQARVELV